MATTLPLGSSPALTLVHPTDLEEAGQALNNSKQWRGPLDLEAYLRREKHLASVDLTKNGGITFWILVDSDEAVSTGSNRKVLAGCESIKKRALLVQDGVVQDATAHGVASVFSPQEYRGRGYGARMIEELGKHLEKWQHVEGRPQFSILYSDIGKKFYAKYGWRPYTSSHMRLPPLPPSASVTVRLPPSTPLTASALSPLCALDEELLRSRLHAIAARDSITKPVVALIPDAVTIAWHHAREDFLAKEFFNKTPHVKGTQVLIPDSSSPSGKRRAWGIWTRIWNSKDISQTKGNTLHLLRLCFEPPQSQIDPEAVFVEDSQATMSILHQAQLQAAEWGMAEVEVWNPTPPVRQAVTLLGQNWSAQGGEGVGEKWATLVDRDAESICSLKWFDDHNVESDGELVEWLENEKFGWC